MQGTSTTKKSHFPSGGPQTCKATRDERDPRPTDPVQLNSCFLYIFPCIVKRLTTGDSDVSHVELLDSLGILPGVNVPDAVVAGKDSTGVDLLLHTEQPLVIRSSPVPDWDERGRERGGGTQLRKLGVTPDFHHHPHEIGHFRCLLPPIRKTLTCRATRRARRSSQRSKSWGQGCRAEGGLT